MVDDSVKLNEVAIVVYKDNYNGAPPPTTISGLKPGDQALDTSCSVLWEYTGSKWCRKAFINGGKIYLGRGKSIREMLMSVDTRMPAWMECYAGDDVRVPRDLQVSKDNLIIRHRMSEPPLVMATYYNELDGRWYNINPAPGAIVTVAGGGWTMWVGYASRVAPYKAVINVWDVGSQNARDTGSGEDFSPDGGDPSGPGGGGVESPADRLSAETVSNLERIANKITINSAGNVAVREGDSENEVKVKKKARITAASLTPDNKLYLDAAPERVVSSDGTVYHMSGEFDRATRKYVLDFNGLVITGLWTIIY